MNHEESAALLTDLIDARLDPTVAARVQAHVEQCPECQEVRDTYLQVRDELLPSGVSVTRHPQSEHLVGFAAGRPVDPEVRNHIVACEACEREIALLRSAGIQAERSPRRSWPELIHRRPVYQLAMTVLLVGFAYPAYLGLVRLPGLERQAAEQRATIETLRRSQADLESGLSAARDEAAKVTRWGGSSGVLIIHSSTRGAGGEAVSQVRIAPGQPSFPVWVEDERYIAPEWQEAEIEISIFTDRVGGTTVWTHHARGSDLWDAEAQALVFLVPAAVVPPGFYRLSLDRARHREQAGWPFAVVSGR